jgi:hypothetical protein
MNRSLYWLILIVVAFGVAAICTWAMHEGGRRLLWRVSAIVAVLLLALGLIDRLAMRSTETPAHSYFFVAVIPTAVTAMVIQYVVHRGQPFKFQLVLAAIVWLAMSWLMLLTVFFP